MSPVNDGTGLAFRGTPFDVLALVRPADAGAHAPVAADDTRLRLRAQLDAARRAAPFAHPRHGEFEQRPDEGPGTPPGAAALRTPAPAAFAPVRQAVLSPADVARLAAGAIAEVFGPGYDQGDRNPALRLAPDADCLLSLGVELDAGGGEFGHGRLRATVQEPLGAPSAAEAVSQAAQVLALHIGLHLGLRDAILARSAEPASPLPPKLLPGPYELVCDVVAVTRTPRPGLVVQAVLRTREQIATRLDGLAVELRERPGHRHHTGAAAQPRSRPDRPQEDATS